MPFRDSLCVGLVKQPRFLDRHVDVWESKPYGLLLERGRDFGVNIWQPVELQRDDMLSEPKCWATLDYTTISDPNVSGRASWTISEPATVYGLGLWFDSELDQLHRLSNAPGNAKSIYGHLFVPLTEQVELDSGDLVSVELAANVLGSAYVWSWKTQIYAGGDQASLKAEFAQSDLLGKPLPQS